MNKPIVTLDVREDLRLGREPFSKIMGVVGLLRPDQKFRLIAPFKPDPILAVLGSRGFDHTATLVESGDWEVLFTRRDGELPSPISSVPDGRVVKKARAEWVDLDARGLEPPEPMIKILEALASLPPGAHLRAWTDRQPMHLYAMLDERGYLGESQKQSNGSFLTTIRSR